MPLVSVIVPAYNAERYIEECATSILNQTIKDLELIIVDDGSTDTTPKICDDLAIVDSRVKVIHKTNGRAASARNAGLKIASGEYISFVDADDWIDSVMLEKMVAQDADVCLCDYIHFSENKETRFSQKSINGGFYNKEEIRNKIFPYLVMDGMEFPITISNCVLLIKRKIIVDNNITYREDVLISEDAPFGSEVLYCANSFSYLKGRYFYHYRITEGSASKAYKSFWWDSFLRINEETEYFFSNCKDYDFTQQIKSNMFYFARAEIYYILANNSLSRVAQDKSIRLVMRHPRVVRMLKNLDLCDAPLSLKCVYWSIRLKSVILRRLVSRVSNFRKKIKK